MSDLPLAGIVQSIPGSTPAVHVSPEEGRSETPKVVSRERDGVRHSLHRFVEARTSSIDSELSRLKRKRMRLNTALEYEVFRRLLKFIDNEARAHLTSEDIWTLKRASFDWYGYFVDLEQYPRVPYAVRSIAAKGLYLTGEVAATQFRLCRGLMGSGCRHPHPKPSVEYAKSVVFNAALTHEELDVQWLHAQIERSTAFGLGRDFDQEDLEDHIANLEAEKAALERSFGTPYSISR
ncbi:hypothetical protein DFH06DRAFT_1352560 [Mycena polygramma]|nr:hypothetical protein DFH06DRAFT_1352560 [Mycena polygramma]